MISPDHARLMARYNRWQNQSLYRAADTLSDAQRREMRGAFFGSIQGTLNHLLWGDQIWMSRFADTPKPAAASIAESPRMIEAWDALKSERAAFDEVIVDWTAGLSAETLAGNLTWYSGAMRREVTKPLWVLVVHMFNHGTHHRGQVHCLLTQLGAKPDDTDLPIMPE